MNLNTSSPSVFGQLEYDLNEHWTGIIGARYTNDAKTYVYNYSCNVCGPVNNPFGGGPYAVTYSTGTGYPNAEHTYHIPTGKVEIDYKIDHDNLLYASVNRGAKGGGWSAPSSGYVNLNPALTAVPVLNLNYNEERLTSYETGFKSTFWNGAARLNGSVFYYDYKDYQGFFLDVATQIVENINATVKGGELELAVVPLRGLNMQLGRLVSRHAAPRTCRRPPAFWSPRNCRRRRCGASMRWPATSGRPSAANCRSSRTPSGTSSSTWSSSTPRMTSSIPTSSPMRGSRIPATSGQWEYAAYCKNFTDRWYRVYNLDLSGFLGIDQSVFAPPRTFGASVAYRWGK